MKIDTLKYNNSDQFSFEFTELGFCKNEEPTKINDLSIFLGKMWKNNHASITPYLPSFRG